MPTVPSRSVGTAPLPGVRVNPNVPTAAFPGAVNTHVDLSGVQRVASDLHQQAVERADQVANLDNDNQLSAAAAQIEQSALSLKGKNAMGALQQARADWEKQTAGIGGSASSDRQRMFLQARAAMRWQQLNQTIERHAAAEGERYDDDTTQAAIKTRINDVTANYADPSIVGSSIAETQAVLHDYASRKGWSPEVTQQAVAETTSQMHATVLRQFASAKQLPEALAYYNDHKDQLVGEDASKASALASAARIQNDGDTAALSILRGDDPAKPISATDAFAKAESIADPSVRKIATEAVLQHFGDLDRLKRIEREDARATVIQGLESSGGRLNTASPQWQAINGYPEGEQVLERQRQILHPPPDPGDPDKYNSYIAMFATSPATRQAILGTNISEIVNDKTLSGGQKTSLIDRIRGEQNRDAAATLADLRRQHADAESDVKQLQRDLATATKQGDDDAKENAQAQLFAAQQKAKTIEGQVLTASHRDRFSAPSASTPSAPLSAEKPANSFGLSATKQLTPDMIRGLRQAGPLYDAYADHLRHFGFFIPSVLPKLPEDEEPKKP